MEIIIAVLSLAALMCLAFIFYMFCEAHLNIVLDYNIKIKKLPKTFDGFALYFISDIHRRRISNKMLEEVKNPEMIIIGGDLTEEGVPFKRVEQNIQKLTRFQVPILFVWGNHDLYVDRERLVNLLTSYDVIILENTVFHFAREGQILNFIGVGDTSNELDCLEDALYYTKEGIRILISHNPDIIDKIKKEDHIPLVLSGHTHGGQIRIFGWGIRHKGGIWPKPFGTLIISKGYGTTSYPLRLGAPPDTLFIRLQTDA